jgi:hypothetical protein
LCSPFETHLFFNFSGKFQIHRIFFSVFSNRQNIKIRRFLHKTKKQGTQEAFRMLDAVFYRLHNRLPKEKFRRRQDSNLCGRTHLISSQTP